MISSACALSDHHATYHSNSPPPLSPATPCAQVVTHDPRAGSRTSGRACGNSPHELGRVRAAYRCFSSPERDRFGVLSAGLRLLLASLPQVNVHGPIPGRARLGDGACTSSAAYTIIASPDMPQQIKLENAFEVRLSRAAP